MAMEMKTARLAVPIPVRLTVEAVRLLEEESTRDGIPVSVLIRRAVLRDLRLGGNDGNPDVTTVNPPSQTGAA